MFGKISPLRSFMKFLITYKLLGSSTRTVLVWKGFIVLGCFVFFLLKIKRKINIYKTGDKIQENDSFYSWYSS